MATSTALHRWQYALFMHLTHTRTCVFPHAQHADTERVFGGALTLRGPAARTEPRAVTDKSLFPHEHTAPNFTWKPHKGITAPCSVFLWNMSSTGALRGHPQSDTPKASSCSDSLLEPLVLKPRMFSSICTYFSMNSSYFPAFSHLCEEIYLFLLFINACVARQPKCKSNFIPRFR